MLRRSIDAGIAVVALLGLSPLFLAIAVLVRSTSQGPAFYGGRRVGLGGRSFRMWKFRTMVRDADRIGANITSAHDARVTAVGRVLRSTKLDELPQFFNLLVGDVTLIGPRAEVPEIVARYTAEQRQLLTVKPGMTGPGQLHFTTDQQEEIPADVDPDEYYVEHLLGPKLAIDLDYVRNRSLGRDLGIVAQTVWVMLSGLVKGGG